MAFFRNRAVNRANLHYGVQAFAEAGGGVFIFVYLLRAGVSIPATLTVLAALLAGRFAMRPAVLPFALRWGLRAALIFGTLANAATFLILTRVHGVDLPLAAFTLVASLGGVFYWTCFHAYFAAIGDAEHRGHQISAREALATALGIVAPLIGGWALVTAGPGRTFAAVGLIQALAVLPLIGAPDVAVAPVAPGAFRAARFGAILFLWDGAIAAGYHYVWQIALFISLGESFSAYGGAMALAALVGAVCGLLLGRHIDAGYGRRAVLIAYAAVTVVVLLRATSVGSPWLAVSANAAGAFSSALLIPAMMTALYNLAKASPCPLRFHIVAEGAWDIGCGGTCLIAAGFARAGLPLSTAILLAVPAAGAAAALLCRYYDRVSTPAAPDPSG
jgi:MFS transporter, DHA1 family, inner membrane transport protein